MIEISAKLVLIGLKLSLPVLAITFMVDVGLAMMTRFGPEFQVLMVAFPIRIGLGLFVLVATAPVLVPMARDACQQALGSVSQLLQKLFPISF